MKITTGGTGMISSQSSMVASTLGVGGVEPGLNYNYTWAVTFANMGSLPGGERPTIFSADSTSYNSDGIRVAKDASSSGVDTKIDMSETAINSAYHSYGGTGNEIPAGAIPDITSESQAAFALADNQSNAVGHGGRYLNIIATFHTFNLTDPTVYPVGARITVGGVEMWADKNAIGSIGPTSHINGVAGTLSSQQDYTDIITAGGHTILTYDFATTPFLVFGNSSDDLDKIVLHPVATKKVNWDITFHGIIISDSVISDSDVTLPIHITSPTIGSGPA